MNGRTEPGAVAGAARQRAAAIVAAGDIAAALAAGTVPAVVTVPLVEAVVLGLLKQGVRKYLAIFGHGNTALAETLRGHVGQTVALGGAVADDGLPTGTETVFRWRIVFGDPSGLDIADETRADTAVTFLKAGTYGVQLEAADGERVTYSDVMAVVVVPGGTVLMVR
jgi:3D-(3,5/4)-trihydroxycyclohexane-1,2-dione acylhydrolase (decyclizing)